MSLANDGPRRPTRLEAALTALGMLASAIAITFAGVLLFGKKSTLVTGPARLLVRNVFHLGLAVALVHAVLVRRRRLSPAAVGFRIDGRTGLQALAGAGLGTLAALGCFGVALAAGAYRVSLAAPAVRPGVLVLLVTLVSLTIAAAFEEVAFRAGLVGPLALAFPPWVAVLVPALPFGLAHALNPSASVAGIAIIVLAGVLLGWLFLDPAGRPAVPSLGLCTGFHLGWNFTVGRLGIPVSGNPPRERFLEVQALDRLWSGGPFGLEAGLGTALVLLVLCLAAGYRVIRGRLPGQAKIPYK